MRQMHATTSHQDRKNHLTAEPTVIGALNFLTFCGAAFEGFALPFDRSCLQELVMISTVQTETWRNAETRDTPMASVNRMEPTRAQESTWFGKCERDGQMSVAMPCRLAHAHTARAQTKELTFHVLVRSTCHTMLLPARAQTAPTARVACRRRTESAGSHFHQTNTASTLVA